MATDPSQPTDGEDDRRKKVEFNRRLRQAFIDGAEA